MRITSIQIDDERGPLDRAEWQSVCMQQVLILPLLNFELEYNIVIERAKTLLDFCSFECRKHVKAVDCPDELFARAKSKFLNLKTMRIRV